MKSSCTRDKMASLGKLSASVVHEINNPIAGILNLIILIKRMIEEGALDRKDLDKFSQYLNLMETETRRISRIVSNLLALVPSVQNGIEPPGCEPSDRQNSVAER